jgi:hypothetical protein
MNWPKNILEANMAFMQAAAALYAEAAAKTSSAPERDFLAMKAARLRERS